MFCPAWNIQGYSKDVFRNFYNDCIKAKDNQKQFVKILATHYADLNALHPFREGNGRTQREFTRELCIKCGYVFDLTQTKHEEMLYASKLSLDKGVNTKLEEIFNKIIVPIHKYKGLYKKLETEILTLSSDDIPQKQSDHQKETLLRKEFAENIMNLSENNLNHGLNNL